MTVNGWTPTQARILQVLSDGLPHPKDSLIACFSDELACIGNLSVHLSYIRRKLRPMGQDIICEYANRKRLYRHVRLLSSDD